jgi:hypothetical protein
MNTTPEIKAHTHAKVLVCLSRGLHTSQQNSVRARWCTEGELIQGQSFATSSDDAVPCSFGEAQSGNGYFGHGGQADVIGHCANLDDDLGGEVGGFGGLLCDPGEGEGDAVVFREEESVEDYLDSV